MTIRVVQVVGARPQFVKLGPVARALSARHGVESLVVHTGQHYDANMSDVFFSELELPAPALNLEIGSGPHGQQTGRMLERLESAFTELRPDVVVVYGDTNSTLAGALAACKMHLPVAHVEAGLRSFNRRMPEEINRIATDHVCDRLCAPTALAVQNLEREGLGARCELTGDVMADAVVHNARLARSKSDALARFGLAEGAFGLATLHRAESTTPEVLPAMLEALARVARRIGRLIVPLHPRTVAAIGRHAPQWNPPELREGRLRIVDPVGALDMLRLLEAARLVVTDSGGVQKEAFLLGTPCVTLRTETEWVETVEAGANTLAPTPAEALAAVEQVLAGAVDRPALRRAALRCYGDGEAGSRVAASIVALATGGRS